MTKAVQLLLCFLPAFIIEENDKFKLEVSEKMHIFFFHLSSWISRILNIDPLEGGGCIVNINLRLFSKVTVVF